MKINHIDAQHRIYTATMRRLLLLAALAANTATIHAQWDLQTSNTTASLRGIHALGSGIAWASGSEGTVLQTTDNGTHWQRCTTPPDAEKLDFRGIQAFDAQTAIVMSSGKGDLSRLYKTTDGCQTWKLVFTNPDPQGFWDAIVARPGSGLLIGDPVASRFEIYAADDAGLEKWVRIGETSSLANIRFDLNAYPGESLYAASNSVLHGSSKGFLFASGGPLGAKLSLASWEHGYIAFKSSIPLATGATSGAFSIAAAGQSTVSFGQLVAVGGNYAAADDRSGTSAWSKDGGEHWKPSKTQPHGYRSAVAYDAPTKTWITVGPNGTDISTDDGRNWHALKPLPGQPDDADQHWNALSLPFVVGPHGRIGILNPAALKQPNKHE